MSEDSDTLIDEQIDVPEQLGVTAIENLQSVIMHNVQSGLADPLLGLSDEVEVELVALAYYDTMRLERMERVIRAAIRDRNDGEGAASKFNLGSYRRAATQLRRRIQEDNARRAKMRERNMRILSGNKSEKAAIDADDSPTSLQAMIASSSVFLRAAGLLEIARKGRIWFDDFHGDFFTDWRGKESDEIVPVTKMDDAFLLNVHGFLLMMDTRLGASSSGNTEKTVHFVADKDHRNEPREWLRGLQWDGEPRLEQLLTRAYGAPNDTYHRAVGRCWFVSMAARISEPGCKVDTMPVLYGPQGTAKSTSLEVIGGQWYATINTTADSKDFLDALRGVLVAEVAELDAISGNRVENSRVKSLLSTRVDKYRPPYGRTSREFRRTAVLVGTTNDPAWHRDETGGRRFWPVHCVGAIDLQWLRENRDQLFAEACSRYTKGEAWWDVPREEQERLVMEHYTADPWEEKIRSTIATWRVYWGGYATSGREALPGYVEAIAGDPMSHDEATHWGTVLTTNRLMTQALGIASERQTRYTAKRIAETMRKLGWTSRAVRARCGDKTVVIRGWTSEDVTRRPAPDEGEIGTKSLPF